MSETHSSCPDSAFQHKGSWEFGVSTGSPSVILQSVHTGPDKRYWREGGFRKENVMVMMMVITYHHSVLAKSRRDTYIISFNTTTLGGIIHRIFLRDKNNKPRLRECVCQMLQS